MTIEEAEYIIKQYEYFLDRSCTCFLGHPPCGYCIECPTKEQYLEALEVVNES